MKTVTVIGGGVAGYTFAIRAKALGLEVNLAEKEYLGGTCLNYGCIPAKALLESSKNYYQTKNNPFGVIAENVSFSFEKAYSRVKSITEKLRNGIQSLIKANGINFYQGEAEIIDNKTVSVGDKEITSDYIVLAAGARTAIPPIPGIENALNSNDIISGNYGDFNSIAIIGGGVIGVEFATFFSELGKEVTVIDILPNVLDAVSNDISKYISMALKKKGVKIFGLSSVRKISADGEKAKVEIISKDKPVEIFADKVLCCTGRKAAKIKSNVEIDFQNGYITDKQFRTSAENIFAIGDCVKGNIQLAHLAAAQGERLAEILAHGKATEIKSVPSCVYCHPNAAIVGDISEGEGRSVGKFNVGANGKALAEDEAFGFIKVVFDGNVLIGAEMVCPNAAEMLGGIANLIDMGATREDIISSVYPHPTVNEAFREAVEDSIGMSIHTVYKR